MPRRPAYDKNDLIARARDLFWARGWSGTSMKDLKAVLHLKPGSFYAAFGSKDALFELTLDLYSRESQARMTELAEIHGAFKTLQMFPRLVIENADAPSKACMLSKTLLELQAHGHPLAEVARRGLADKEKAFASLFAQAQADGQIDPALNPDILARRYQSDLLGLQVSSERLGADAMTIADEIAEGLARLKPPQPHLV